MTLDEMYTLIDTGKLPGEASVLSAGLCNTLRREIEALNYWKADALERIADDDRAYQEQAAMLRQMNDVIAKVADHLHAAKLEMLKVIDIKDEYAEVVKRSKKPNSPNEKLTGTARHEKEQEK